MFLLVSVFCFLLLGYLIFYKSVFMKKLFLAAQIFLLPLHLIASNQIFEAGSMVRLEEPSAGMNEAYWLFDSSNHYFGHYPPQAAATQGYSSYFEEGSYALNSSGNNQFSAQLSSTAYVTIGSSGGTGSASRTATVTLTSPFSATYSGTRSESGTSSSFNGSLTIYPAQDYAPEVLPIGSVWDSNNEYYYSASYSGPTGGNSYTVLSSNIIQAYDPDTGLSSGSYTYTKLGPNFGRVAISSPENYYSASINLFFRSPYEVYFYGNSTDYHGSYTDWGAFSVSYPSSYSPPAIFPAPTSLPQDQILQIAGTNSDLSLDLAGGTWTYANGSSGSFTYTYSVQSGGIAGLTLNRTGQNAPASPEHFALRFTDDGVGEVVYSSLDGSQSFNLVGLSDPTDPTDPTLPPTPSLAVVESYGNTDLLEDSSGYYAGSASTPLIYNGTQLGPIARFSALGVDLYNGQYRLVMYYGSQYIVFIFNTSGVSQGFFSGVSDLIAEETKLSQDLDGDGHVGTPPIAPPASLAGKSFVVTQLTGGSKSVPDQITFTADTFSYGFSGNLRASGVSYTYSNGTMVYGIEERIDFAFTSSTEGTYEAGEVGPDGTFYIENTGTFEEANISFSLQTNWQRTETMDSELSTNYWQIESTSGDSAVYNDGELNFTFDPSSDPDPLAAYSEEQEIEMHYAGALPLDEDWQIVIDDTYVSDSVNQFAMGYQIMFQRSLYCEFGFLDQTSGRGVYFYADSYNSDTNQTDYYGDYYRPVVSNIADPRMQNGLNFRIQHLANTRELVYSYQPDGASDWTEVARINLSTGAATGLSGSGSLSGQLPSSSENLRFGVDIDKYSTEAIPIENIEIGGIEIGTFTPPIIPVDSDGDGLDDSVETNTGVYVSPSDTGTNSQLLDSSGDGFTDGEMVSAGYDPNINYSQIINILGQNPSRFGLVDPLSIVDAQLGQLSLEQGIDGNFDMNFDLEMSTDLQTWAPHSSHTIEISIPDQTKTFMRLNVK